MSAWLTIEVQNGATSGEDWRRAHGRFLIEAAVTNGAVEWIWHHPLWGVIVEVEFAEESVRDAFRHLPAVTAALDAVPDPVVGLLVYPGRGGGSAASVPRLPRPDPAHDAAAREEPFEELLELEVDEAGCTTKPSLRTHREVSVDVAGVHTSAPELHDPLLTALQLLPEGPRELLRVRREFATANENDAVFATRNGTWHPVVNVERRWR